MISWLLRLGSKVRIKNWNFGAPESELWTEKLGWEPDPRQGFHRGFSVLGGRLRPGALALSLLAYTKYSKAVCSRTTYFVFRRQNKAWAGGSASPARSRSRFGRVPEATREAGPLGPGPDPPAPLPNDPREPFFFSQPRLREN